MARRTRKLLTLRAAPPDLASARLFLNRELSWLEFNGRVLDEARDPSVPLVERLKFLAIVASNLDEFFMVRVAGLKQQISGNVAETPPDGLTAAEQLTAISHRAHAMVAEQYRIWREEVEPGLATLAGVRLLHPATLTAEQKALIASTFSREVWPVLTPLAVDPGHPFPTLRNRSLNLAVSLQKEKGKVPPDRILLRLFRCRPCSRACSSSLLVPPPRPPEVQAPRLRGLQLQGLRLQGLRLQDHPLQSRPPPEAHLRERHRPVTQPPRLRLPLACRSFCSRKSSPCTSAICFPGFAWSGATRFA